MSLPDAHAKPAIECLAVLDTTPEGLASTEAARRLAQHGPNRLPEQRGRGPILRFLVHFNNVLIYVLLGAAVVTGCCSTGSIPA